MHERIQKIIKQLDLLPHPEGGFYRETWRSDEVFDRVDKSKRSTGTAIYFLIPEGVVTHWHVVKSAEMWHFYSGSPLVLEIENEGGEVDEIVMSSNLEGGFVPQALVKPNQWQRAYSTGLYSLVGCTVSPGFDFEDFSIRE